MKAVIFFLLAWCTVSCTNTNNKHLKVDEFYTDKGDFDMARIPLIKPYEATTPATNPDWIVSSIDTNSLPVTMPGTKEIRVFNNIILLHNINTVVDYQPVKEAWFVIFAKSHSIKSYKTHQEYINYLKFIGLSKAPELYPIGRVYDYFDSYDHIDWQKVR